MSRLRDEQGMVTAFVTIFVVALLFVIGLVLDGGYLLAAQREASNVAAQAARAGAQELDEDAFRRDSSKDVIDPVRAAAAVQAFLTRVGRTGVADTSRPDQVTVTVTIKRKMLILPLGEREVHGTATAHGVQGD